MPKQQSKITFLVLVNILQGLINIALPIFAYIYYLKGFSVGDYNLKSNFLNSAFQLFPLAIFFIFFMQIVAASAGKFDKTIKQALLDLLLPFAYIAIANIAYAKPVAWFLFEMGALYASSILLAFFLIVFFTVIIERTYKKWDKKNFLLYVLMALPQVVFLLPGIVGIYFFNKLIIQEIMNGSISLYSIVTVLAYLLSLAQASIYNYHWMRKEAAI